MISVIVPVFNESENIRPLALELAQAAHNTPIREILFIDDASTDDTPENLKAMQAEMPMLRVLRHSKRCGQSVAMMSGARAATSSLLVFMDGDGQNNPADIEGLYKAYEALQKTAVSLAVLGQRLKREDNWLRRLSSRAANRIRAFILKDNTRDTGCSLKLICREDYISLPYFNHMHRFLPALLMRQGVKLVHVDVSHRPRLKGVSKYGFWGRALAGAWDLFGVAWLCHRAHPHDLIINEDMTQTSLSQKKRAS